MKITKCEENPIVRAGGEGWRAAATFNPAVIRDGDKFYMLERAAEGLRPFVCSFGLLESDDGVHFTPAEERPVLTARALGYEEGTVEDPRLVKIDGLFYLTFAYRPYTYNCYPTGVGVPDYTPLRGELDKGINNTRSAVAVSEDLRTFRLFSSVNGAEVDERDNVLFPEKIGGKFWLLRRPKQFGDKPSIYYSTSEDCRTWSEPELFASPLYDWEGGKIGAGAPPVRTDRGWLLLYHGVDKQDVYRVGAMLLDKDDPTRVLARTAACILEPTEYYEKFGLVIPNVVFPTACVEKEGLLYIYYGCCDTSISLATVRVDELLDSMESLQ